MAKYKNRVAIHMDFEDKANYSTFLKIVLLGTIIIVAIAMLITYAVVPDRLLFAKVISIIALVIAVFSLWLFLAMRFGADSKSVYAKIGPFTYRILRKNIVKASVIEKVPFWAGWGIRIWWWEGVTLAFVSQHSPSLKIDKKSGIFKHVVFSVSNPQDFAKKASLKLSK